MGVNIDHVATLREARKATEPDPVQAAKACEKAGADGIVAHLREDRRHIQEKDIRLIKKIIQIKFNLEIASTVRMLQIASSIKPDQLTLVPERRLEITTEGGLDVLRKKSFLKNQISFLKEAGIKISLFIDPIIEQVRISKEVGADAIELHTGRFANTGGEEQKRELNKLIEATRVAHGLGLEVHAGHGLTYENVGPITRIPFVEELNIGHSIVSKAVFVGLEMAVKEMLTLMRTQK